MINKDKIIQLADAFFAERPDVFLVDLKICAGNQINVKIDADNGVLIADCVDLSRQIEHNLDREVEDFSLEVASAGIDTPLKFPRQYLKNIGRDLKVILTDGTEQKGKICASNELGVTLEVIKKVKTKKVKEEVQIAFNNIKESKIT
ncbi:MAG: ribosome assembly cofactor RimP, partial [Bacteroidota bacterium]